MSNAETRLFRTPLSLEQALVQVDGLLAAGRWSDARQHCSAILSLWPDQPDALLRLCRIAGKTDGPAAALDRIRRMVAAQPGLMDVYAHLGAALKGLERTEDAAAGYARAIAIAPVDSAEIHYNLGNLLRTTGRPAEAAARYRQAIALRPDFPEAWFNQGVALRSLDRLEDAAVAYRNAIALRPDHSKARINLANTLVKLDRHADAVPHYEAALALGMDEAAHHGALAGALETLGRRREAEAALRRGLLRWPETTEFHGLLGRILSSQGRMIEAEACYLRLANQPSCPPDILISLCGVDSARGDPDRSRAWCERALEVDPDSEVAMRNLLLNLAYQSHDPAMVFAEHRRHGDRFARPHHAEAKPHGNLPDPNRRLRIGYLSYDFRNHAVARNLLPVLSAHDHRAVEVFCYACSTISDSITASFQHHADHWRPVADISDDAIADRIRADGIDILVSLAGRFDGNRPLVCARRPAPVQISFHDVATSGMEVMDYLVADAALCPRDSAERFTERILRLPSFYITTPLRHAPDPMPPPMAVTGAPTFGSFNNPAKVTGEVLDLWARLLDRLPTARLVLKYLDRYESPDLRDRTLSRLAAAGVDTRRVQLMASVDRMVSHLALYDRIDVALDPFPFCGSTTTFEALWMGVPVVTLPRGTMVSRWSAAMLKTLEMTDLIAGDKDEYVAIAARLAADLPRLSAMRSGLRAQVRASPLCDGPLKARQMERLYRAVWRRWCAARGS
ncbi:tetratricopeptide repeat protein [Azospirillum doebereinerae]|nr:tetratricopeptide repeat protein [Azospirillum doebereinerae]